MSEAVGDHPRSKLEPDTKLGWEHVTEKLLTSDAEARRTPSPPRPRPPRPGARAGESGPVTAAAAAEATAASKAERERRIEENVRELTDTLGLRPPKR